MNLVEMCVRLMIPGALIHARPRMGKMHAIDYVMLRLALHPLESAAFSRRTPNAVTEELNSAA